MEPDFDVIIPLVIVSAIGLIGVFVLLAIVRGALRRAAANLAGGTVMDTFAAQGVRARGLVLTSNRVSSAVTVNGRRFERRSMTLDVEIPGRAPFVTSGSFLVPRGIVEALPGSSLELAIDPTDASQITVLGPGGFTGPWLKLGPPNPY